MIRACLLLLLLSGCSSRPLICRSEYITPEFLASKHAITPDPNKSCYYGQQIVMRWNIPKECFCQDAELVLSMRYGTKEIETVSFPLEARKGWQLYRLINDTYWCLEGISSYKAELFVNGSLLDAWHHHLYTEIIEIPIT